MQLSRYIMMSHLCCLSIFQCICVYTHIIFFIHSIYFNPSNVMHLVPVSISSLYTVSFGWSSSPHPHESSTCRVQVGRWVDQYQCTLLIHSSIWLSCQPSKYLPFSSSDPLLFSLHKFLFC